MGKAENHRARLNALIALGMVLAVYALVWLAFGVRYEVNDDATLCNIAAGAYGEDSQYLVYINILIGYFLKPFYWVLPGVNWLYFCRRRRMWQPLQFCAGCFWKSAAENRESYSAFCCWRWQVWICSTAFST